MAGIGESNLSQFGRNIESITPAASSLVGSVLIGPNEQPLTPTNLPQLLAGRSLKLLHARGLVSSQIMSAMLNKTVLPKVEINTSNGVITLTNVQIVRGVPFPPRHGSGGKGTRPEQTHSNEIEEFDLTFNTIIYTVKLKSKAGQDSWSATT